MISYMALAYTVRDRLLRRWINTIETYIKQEKPKIVCYLSAEFLLGPRLGNCLINLGIYDQVHEAIQELGFDLKELLETLTTLNMMPNEQMGVPAASPDTTATSSPTPKADAGAEKHPDTKAPD
jgi:hypothetical protein